MKFKFLVWEQEIKSRFDYKFYFIFIEFEMFMRCLVREVYQDILYMGLEIKNEVQF